MLMRLSQTDHAASHAHMFFFLSTFDVTTPTTTGQRTVSLSGSEGVACIQQEWRVNTGA